MNISEVIDHGVAALIAAKQGDAMGAARHALDAVLAAVPTEDARTLLDAAAIRRANAIADIAEAAKFATFADDGKDDP